MATGRRRITVVHVDEDDQPSGIRYVLDYAAMGAPGRPRMIHRPDCPHPRTPEWREATADELLTLPRCADCERREGREGRAG
jgi:hypothetical protein